jgi:peptidoglycan/xylan/chitin deacetylase (PgdA/CDA1 family)
MIKEIALRTLSVPGVTTPFAPLLHDRAVIFMLHRFRDADRGVEGIDPAVVEGGLSYLRRHRYDLVGLEEVFGRLAGDGPPLRGAVAFTIDDGYLEQATIAAPLFARYDCPVTTFVATDFLDRKIWFWWDQLEYVFLRSRRREVAVRLDGIEARYSWKDDPGRRRALNELNLMSTRLPDALKHAVIAAVARSAEVEIPAEPPSQYLPMSWDLVRACERRGMSFGPHTVTHPILSRTADEHSRREVTDSWTRLRAEAIRPLPVFCYPNGCWDDFGPREIAVLEELGFTGAVAGENAYADARVLRRHAAERFKVPRFGYPEDLPHAIQIVSGVERLKQIVRGEAVA